MPIDKNYNDRAGHRRKVIGSSHSSEKTQVASVDESISNQNKGFKMLSKLGWKEGQKLGRNEDGIEEPISLMTNTGTLGLGFSGGVVDATKNVNVCDTKKQQQKNFIWKKTQERMKQIQRHEVFDLNEENENNDDD